MLTVSPDRFVTAGSGVTFSCSVTGGSDITWRFAAPGSAQIKTIPSPNIISFDPSSDAGAYYCVINSPVGEFVSNPVVLVQAGTDNTISGKGWSTVQVHGCGQWNMKTLLNTFCTGIESNLSKLIVLMCPLIGGSTVSDDLVNGSISRF